MYVCVCVCVCVYVCMYVCMDGWMYICIYVCMYVYMYVRIHTHTHTHTLTHTHTFIQYIHFFTSTTRSGTYLSSPPAGPLVGASDVYRCFHAPPAPHSRVPGHIVALESGRRARSLRRAQCTRRHTRTPCYWRQTRMHTWRVLTQARAQTCEYAVYARARARTHTQQIHTHRKHTHNTYTHSIHSHTTHTGPGLIAVALGGVLALVDLDLPLRRGRHRCAATPLNRPRSVVENRRRARHERPHHGACVARGRGPRCGGAGVLWREGHLLTARPLRFVPAFQAEWPRPSCINPSHGAAA